MIRISERLHVNALQLRRGVLKRGLKQFCVNTILTDVTMKARKTITGRDLRRGAPEEQLGPGEAVIIEKKSGKLFELKRVDATPKSMVAAVDKLIEEVPIPGERIPTDLARLIVEERE
jgi:hypothetical protein